MGTDFLAKARKTFEKSWDKAAVEANTPDLFRKAVERTSPRFEAEACPGAHPKVGDEYCVRAQDGKLVGLNGLSPAISVSNPPPAMKDALSTSNGVARARVVACDSISGMVEIEIS